MVFISRFAPSPTGYLHLGHAFSALTVWEAASAHGGTVHLRIEDIDETRARPEFETAIEEDLAWLGLTWPRPVMRQSDRRAHYQAALADLAQRGLVYRCFRTRREIGELSAPHGPIGDLLGPPPHPLAEEAQLLSDGKPFAWRLSAPAAKAALGSCDLTWQEDAADGQIIRHTALPDAYNGILLGRKDIGVSYHIASVCDDIDQGITHISRGEDLADTAGLHRLLYALFGDPAPPPIYRHHRLITDAAGRRLAKRDQDLTLRALRAAGETPNGVRARLGLDYAPYTDF